MVHVKLLNWGPKSIEFGRAEYTTGGPTERYVVPGALAAYHRQRFTPNGGIDEAFIRHERPFVEG